MSNPKRVKVPSRIRVRVDAAGITAINDRGDEIRYAMPPSSPGFNPLELLSASLGICTAINLRKELSALAGGTNALSFDLAVECVKALDPPSRVERLDLIVRLPEHVKGAAAAEVIQRAEAACTIANTLLGCTEIKTRSDDPVRDERSAFR
jgi:uncharacterized OsmC-like protein